MDSLQNPNKELRAVTVCRELRDLSRAPNSVPGRFIYFPCEFVGAPRKKDSVMVWKKDLPHRNIFYFHEEPARSAMKMVANERKIAPILGIKHNKQITEGEMIAMGFFLEE